MIDEELRAAMERQRLETQRMLGQGLGGTVSSTHYAPGNYISSSSAQGVSLQELMRQITILNTSVISLQERLARMEGFYAWVMHTYPEHFAEFQAMEDLKKVCDKDE